MVRAITPERMNELRRAVLNVLRSGGSYQFGGVKEELRQTVPGFSPDDYLGVHEILWALLVQRVIAPGFDSSNLDLPFFHITTHGKRCLEQDEFLPHDPSGFSSRLQSQINVEIDQVVCMYLTESLQTFNADLHFSSVVMLGVASERLLDLLQEALLRYLTAVGRHAQFNSSLTRAGQSAKRRFDVLHRALVAEELPPELSDSLDLYLSGIFTIVRHSRNDAGHPTGKIMSGDEAHANLLLFARYCQRAYALITFFQENTI